MLLGLLAPQSAVEIARSFAPRIQNWNDETLFPFDQVLIQECSGFRLTVMVVRRPRPECALCLTEAFLGLAATFLSVLPLPSADFSR